VSQLLFMSKKAGRPKIPKDEARGRFISTRLSPPEYKEIAEAIKKSGIAKAEWTRNSLLKAARAGNG
jgi:hypothetical protein